MKKSFLTLLISLILAFTMTIIGCSSNQNPTTTTSQEKTTATSKETSLEDSTSLSSTKVPSAVETPTTTSNTTTTSKSATTSSKEPSSSSSLELINPSVNSGVSGVVVPSVNSNPNTSANAVNPGVTATSNATSNQTSTQTSNTSVWLPPINDYDTNNTPNYGNGYNDSTKYNYSGVTYTAKQGGFTTSGSTYTTNAASTIAVNTSTPFPYGTISVDLTYKGGDSGIIFGYQNTGSNKWEGSGISFYFLFINETWFHLGKSVNGTWSTVGARYMGNNDVNHTYNLKVVMVSNKIIGIIDNLVAFTYVDSAHITSTGFGFRAGVSGTAFTNLTVTNDYVFENDSYSLDNGYNYTYPTTYTTLQGGFTTSGTNHTSSAANSLMVNTTPFRYGSIQTDIKASNSSDNGIVFGYSKKSDSTANWEGSGLSYYFLFVNYQGIVILGKTDNGTWSTAGQSNGVVIKNFSITHKLTLVFKERQINVYLNDTLLFSSYDADPLFGAGYGIRAGGSGVAFNNFTVTSDYLK